MAASYDEAERRPQEAREADLFARLPQFVASAIKYAPGLAEWLKGVDPASLTSREALQRLPILHKSDLMEFQAKAPPFAGFANPEQLRGGRIFMSPGPIWEPQGLADDPAQAARAFYAVGVRAGDIVHNSFSYHMTPGAFMMDHGARALGCAVFPAGTGNTDMQVEAAAALKPTVYCGTPDFLKVLLDRAAETGKDLSSFKIGLVSGGALFPSLRSEYFERGVRVYQCYATAEFGVIAYESAAEDGSPNPGMIVNENLIVEIVRPGTGDPVPEGEVGELVVTSLNPAYPLVRLSTGDLSAVLPGRSPCGRTGMRIKGWMGRADQRTKVKGMFVDPKQIAEVLARHPELKRGRLVVGREGARDVMTFLVEPGEGANVDASAVEATLRDVTKLGGKVRPVDPGSLPNDGKVISDERDYAA
ncbi:MULTISPECIES: AMP-binding protein [unclassified Aminobacter]|uniref:phenylacetate--CoA ligase family protein n=1 Tax=unclassified Aminobacter TaxID=2644704 RepID=UPI000465917C|nr:MULTISPECIES: AMP-binding protein [unclassified Aminobacter]TWG49397.1 phenylacetate-CoA ligase [Aminobacter sp. J44]TWH23446.1 phenylacetate-CoA ligase [Aminobacter sp. J15]